MVCVACGACTCVGMQHACMCLSYLCVCVCVCVCELIITPVAICMDNQSIVSLYGQKSYWYPGNT